MTQTPAMSEADLCAAFIAEATKQHRDSCRWIAYPETAGFDILLARACDGAQIGIEAKLTLNTKVLVQALPYRRDWLYADEGPDYRAVLVPALKVNAEVSALCDALGITVIQYRGLRGGAYYGQTGGGPVFTPDLPQEGGPSWQCEAWHEWAPGRRCALPDYVPDVAAGASAPVTLTAWKVAAIKLLVLLEERPVGRGDLKHLKLSPTSWLCPGGWLDRTPQGWVAGRRTPNLQRQHPRNYAEIRADKAKWAPPTDGPLFAPTPMTRPDQATPTEARGG